MIVGDKVKVGGREATVVVAEPDANGELVVKLAEGFYSNVHPDRFDAAPPTWRATNPDLGQVTVDLPVDGNPVQRAVWSQAATDAARR